MILELDYSTSTGLSDKIILDSCDIDVLSVHELQPVNSNDPPTNEQLSFALPANHKQPVTSPANHKQPVITLANHKQPVITLANQKQPVMKPANHKQLVTSPATSPANHKQPATTPANHKQPATTPAKQRGFQTLRRLSFSVSTWSLTIDIGATLRPVCWVRIQYQTRPSTRSLHWR